ncbi:MAG TPA: DUF1631 family protein [Burkholderiales bacterium]|nr:DUF1631 family protein [Burkholderiales bacterium]
MAEPSAEYTALAAGAAGRSTGLKNMENFLTGAAQTADTRPRPSTESKALLSQCKELARARLSRIISEALDKVENDLFTLADNTASRTEQQVLLEAMAQVKQYRGDIAGAFDQCFLDIFDRRLNAKREALSQTQNLTLEDLSLVGDDAIEEKLAINELARKTRNGLDPDQVMGIRARFGHLLAQEALDDDSNPLSAEVIFEALKQACAKIPGEFAVKRSLLNAFQPYVAAGMRNMYADVNQNLIAHHILPRIKHQVQRSHAPLHASQQMGLSQMLANSQAMGTSQGMGMPGIAGVPGAMGMGMGNMAMSGQVDLSALLASVLSGPPGARQQVAMMMSDPSRYSLDNAMATPATPALVNSLSQLQANVAAGMYEGHADYLAALDQQVRSQSHPLDQLTIELVTMVFDYILDDKDVPETVKGEISRLQIVAVKAALLDRTFFARRQHPMRQLLDRIAGAAQDPEIDTRPESRFIGDLRGITARTIERFDDDLDVFRVALEELEQAISNTTAVQRNQVETASVKLVREEEREAAHTTAMAEIRKRLTRKTPGFVREFLYEWWSQVLVEARVNERQGDDSWDQRLGIVEALVWSVSPLKTAEVQKLASMLPGLMRSVLRGMNAIEMAADARHLFFTQLMQTHTSAINTAKALSRSGEMTIKELNESTAEIESEEAPEQEPMAQSAPVDTVSGFDAGDLYLHSVKSLERGSVVEFVDGETIIRSKLSWISPKHTILLFTSSTGAAKQYSPTALAEALKTGKVRIVEEVEALIDRVVGAIVNEQAAQPTVQ